MTTRPARRPVTVMGFDFGTARIGVAIGQELTATATPLAALKAHKGQPDWDGITRLIQEWQPTLLVVGLPRHVDGTANTVTTAALDFSRQLHNRYQREVATIDERLSSHEANDLLSAATPWPKRKRSDGIGVDAVAAMLILESWFNQSRSGNLDGTVKA
jgi:putative Holliday junction resolvase